MRLTLGIDPGPEKHGWCLLSLLHGERPRWVDGGHATFDDIDDSGATRVVIERPKGYVHEHKRGAALIDTAVSAGELFGWYQASGVDTYWTSAEEWRRLVTGKATASDARIEAALRLLVDGVPKRCSKHARDACGAALGLALQRGWLVNGRGRKAA